MLYIHIVLIKSADGKARVKKELIEAVDEENNLISFKVIDGDILEHYKSFKFTIQCIPKEEGGVVRWTLEYEKQHAKIPESSLESLMQFSIGITIGLDIHLGEIGSQEALAEEALVDF